MTKVLKTSFNEKNSDGSSNGLISGIRAVLNGDRKVENLNLV